MHAFTTSSCGCHLICLYVCLLFFLCFLLDSVFFNLFIRTICNSVWMYVAVVVTISRNAFLFIIFYNKEMSFSIECNGELNGHWKEYNDDDGDAITKKTLHKTVDWRGSVKETNKCAERLIDITSLFDDLLTVFRLKKKIHAYIVYECRYCIGIVSLLPLFFLSSFSSMFLFSLCALECAWFLISLSTYCIHMNNIAKVNPTFSLTI